MTIAKLDSFFRFAAVLKQQQQQQLINRSVILFLYTSAQQESRIDRARLANVP